MHAAPDAAECDASSWHKASSMETEVRIQAGDAVLDGNLVVPANARGIVLFVHGSGSSRFSPRNRFVAECLNQHGLATLLFDLLTPAEEAEDLRTAELRFDIGLLAKRLEFAADWTAREPATAALKIGYFGSSTGGGAALVAAANRPERCSAVVSRGGRPDLAGSALPKVKAPTLLIVGGSDPVVIDLNQEAVAQMRSHVNLEIVMGATHLFEEAGTLEKVADLAADWFVRWLGA